MKGGVAVKLYERNVYGAEVQGPPEPSYCIRCIQISCESPNSRVCLEDPT
jgi:hypothetical protein